MALVGTHGLAVMAAASGSTSTLECICSQLCACMSMAADQAAQLVIWPMAPEPTSQHEPEACSTRGAGLRFDDADCVCRGCTITRPSGCPPLQWPAFCKATSSGRPATTYQVLLKVLAPVSLPRDL